MSNYFQKTTSPAPLAVFRIVFGLLLFVSMIRFWANGWIEDLYIDPVHHFSFYGFGFVKPLGEYTYLLFAACAICSLLVAVGLYYRIASIGLFLSFTYIELIDKSTYLNHYYFISMLSLMLIVLPGNAYFSVDAFRKKELFHQQIPQWNIDVVKIFVGMLYFFAGIAKINSEWLLEAQPLRIWLPAHSDAPVIGALLAKPVTAYVFSWFGCIYDLSIPFLLFNRSTRIFAYLAVIVFHAATAFLFPIGMFPYIMIATALIFFSAEFHEKVIKVVISFLRINAQISKETVYSYSPIRKNILLAAFTVFFLIHIVFPFRYLLYPGELFWTEQGYRFSWRVMLMEKAGAAQFIVKDKQGETIVINNEDFLTPLQEKMVATQPDMMLQYAHILRDHFRARGIHDPQVFADTYVTLNGRRGKPLIDRSIDLAKQEDSFEHKAWILPFEDEISGF